MRKSLQAIEDFYVARGYKGNRLREALSKNNEYQKILRERKDKLGKKFSLTKSEQRKYVMSVDKDYEILSKIKQLENLRLTKEEKFLVRFVRSQLEHDWRKWIIKELDKMLLKNKPHKTN